MFLNGGICLFVGINLLFYLKSKLNFIKMGIERIWKLLVFVKKKIFLFLV